MIGSSGGGPIINNSIFSIDLARHYRGAGLVIRDRQLRKPGARATPHQADVIGDLVQQDRQRVHRSGELDPPCTVNLFDAMTKGRPVNLAISAPQLALIPC